MNKRLPMIAGLVFVTGAVMADADRGANGGNESAQPQPTEASPRSPGDAARAGRGTPGNQGGPSAALPGGGVGVGAMTDGSFEGLDVDHDGRISRKEARPDGKLGKVFAGLDKNGDGQLDQTEFALFGGSDHLAPKAPAR